MKKNKNVMKPLLTFFIVILMVFGTWRAVVFIRNHNGDAESNIVTTDQTQSSSLLSWIRNWKATKNSTPTPENDTLPGDENSIVTMTETWTYAMQGAQGGKDEMDGVSVDTKGNVIFGGPFQDTVDFN